MSRTHPTALAPAYSEPMAEPTEPRDRPTLLVFTRGAAGDREQRRLLPSRFGGIETALHRACLDATLAAGRRAGCRLTVASSARLELPSDVLRIPQRGASFGARIRHAVAAAEALADGPLLVVGTDVPDLDAGHITDALERLRDDTAPVVVGPSTDGGFYLLASDGPVSELLDGVRWCRPDTLKSLLGALARAGRHTERLEPLADLDHRVALERWVARHHAGPLRRLIARLRRALGQLNQISAPPATRAPSLLLAAPLGGRAPPRIAARI